MIARGRKTSVDDYPEHLNPFADDNEDLRNNRFNTTGRRRARPSLKDAWESSPSPALDVAVTVRGPTPARPPPPRLSLSPPPPPSEVQRQPAPPPRPLTQPPPAPAPAPDATPGKPARRRFSFSRTLDAGSRLLLSPALLRRFRPGAAPASAKPPPRDAPPPAGHDLRGSIRRSQSQAIPTTPPPIGDASGLNSRAGSNWTLAEGGFPQRIPSYRPKKRRAPPPPVPVTTSPVPAASATTPTAETSDTTKSEQEAEVGVAVAAAGPVAAELTETTTVVVTVAAATPPPTSPEEAPVVEVSVAEEAAGGGTPAGATPASAGDQHQPQTEAVAPLAEGEDDADLAAADGSRQPEAEAEERASTEAGQPPTEEHPSSDVAASAEGSEPPAPSGTVRTTTETVEVREEQVTEVSEKIVGSTDTVQLTSTAEGETPLSLEPPSSKVASEETPVEITPQVLTLTIREYKEPTTPSAEVAEVSQEAKDNVDGESRENLPATSLEVMNPTVEVEVKVETTTTPEPAIPVTVTNAKEPSEDGAKEHEVPEEPRQSALASFREDYLTKHYKGDLPVLQITESDLADEEERKEGSPVVKVSTALPVLHISEEDLKDEPAEEKTSEAAAAEHAANGPSVVLREREVEGETASASPSPRRSLDGGVGRKESPQPPPRQSSAQELNSKIYFRVLPPLAGGGGPPQLKTFAPPSSPPGRGPKPQPPLRNGVAPASASGEASPPRTKSPLPTPRRRHQPVTRDA